MMQSANGVPKYNQVIGDVKGKEGFFRGGSGLQGLEQFIDEGGGNPVGELLPLNCQG